LFLKAGSTSNNTDYRRSKREKAWLFFTESLLGQEKQRS
jgi:hypothetical protein